MPTYGLSLMQRVQYAFMTYATRPTANSTAAIIIWLLGALATRTFLMELGISAEGSLAALTLTALVFQSVLTLLEGPIWHKALRVHRMRLILGTAALLIDTALNTGGCWFLLKNLGNTTFWQAIATATGTTTGPASLTILLLSILIAFGISAGPEALWDVT